MRETLEREDEQDAGDEIEKRDLVRRQQLGGGLHYFFGSFFLNISSMRSVTRKPPKVLMATSTTAAAPRMEPRPLVVAPAARMAPTMITELIALVTLMSGVCSAGVTFHTTW